MLPYRYVYSINIHIIMSTVFIIVHLLYYIIKIVYNIIYLYYYDVIYCILLYNTIYIYYMLLHFITCSHEIIHSVILYYMSLS
jgi:hypothetical protein